MEAITYDHPDILPIEGMPDIHLRLTRPDDGDELFDVIEQDRKHLEPFQWWVREVRTPEQAAEHARKAVGRTDAGHSLQYRVIKGDPAQDGPMIGTITVYQRDPSSNMARFGYWLTSAEQGQGYATAATARVLEEAKASLHLQRVDAHIPEKNTRSQLLAKRLGCTMLDGASYRKLVPIAGSPKKQSFTVDRWAKIL